MIDRPQRAQTPTPVGSSTFMILMPLEFDKRNGPPHRPRADRRPCSPRQPAMHADKSSAIAKARRGNFQPMCPVALPAPPDSTKWASCVRRFLPNLRLWPQLASPRQAGSRQKIRNCPPLIHVTSNEPGQRCYARIPRPHCLVLMTVVACSTQDRNYFR